VWAFESVNFVLHNSRPQVDTRAHPGRDGVRLA